MRRIKIPEGPEVKRCGDLIRDQIEGKKIIEIDSLSAKGKFQTLNGKELFSPAIVKNVFTIGKVIFIALSEDQTIISTLGMAGWWYPPINQLSEELKSRLVYSRGKMVPLVDVLEKSLTQARIRLTCDDGTQLLYVDQRNFGNFTICDSFTALKRIKDIGFDPLGTSESAESYWEIFRQGNPESPIASILLDQSLFSGIGNIYRAEILYLARVSPHRLLKDVSDAELRQIAQIATIVLNLAYKGQGNMKYPWSIFQKYLPEDFIATFEQDRALNLAPTSRLIYSNHLVYGQKADPFGQRVVNDSLNGRTVWWCPEIQS